MKVYISVRTRFLMVFVAFISFTGALMAQGQSKMAHFSRPPVTSQGSPAAAQEEPAQHQTSSTTDQEKENENGDGKKVPRLHAATEAHKQTGKRIAHVNPPINR